MFIDYSQFHQRQQRKHTCEVLHMCQKTHRQTLINGVYWKPLKWTCNNRCNICSIKKWGNRGGECVYCVGVSTAPYIDTIQRWITWRNGLFCSYFWCFCPSWWRRLVEQSRAHSVSKYRGAELLVFSFPSLIPAMPKIIQWELFSPFNPFWKHLQRHTQMWTLLIS